MTAVETQDFSGSGLSDLVKSFLVQQKDKNNSYKYVEQIDQMMPKNSRFIVVDYNDLVSFPTIDSKFNENPDEVLFAFSRAIKEILQERFPAYAEKIKDDTRARIVNYPVQRSLRQINSEIINKMTSVSGMVVRASEVKPLARELMYVCPENHYTQIILQKGMSVNVPAKCSDPKCNHRELEVKPESSKFIDFQILRLQELPEDLPPGQLPHYIDVAIKQDLVDNARPGDRIILSGIVRIEQESISGISRNSSGLYRLRIDGNNVEFLGGRGSKTSRRTEREEISPEEEKIIKSLAKDDDIYQKLVDSFAPHIRGHPVIKEAILLLIVGSTQRLLQDGSKIRGDVNVFLVGDPGTAKSEMLKFCARIAPRGLYTSGRGSTAAGLTAAVVRDKSGIMMLEAGAVVLGDQGLVCIDHLIKQDLVDNARPGDRIILSGIVRIEQESISGISRNSSGLYRLRIDGNNVEFLGGRGSKTSRRTEREEISPEEEKIIKSLAKDDDIYQKLVDSFAPHIRGHPVIKEAILLLIVGSTQRLLQDGSKIRGDVNVFLVGDPGTAKSEMLKFCARIAPRGLYTSGRGSTAAGLTAAVVRDKSGIMMLEAGAVVLGDQGLVCIDEFDKMKPEDRSALHEVMEQQSASIAKGGIVATLNARTSILAAANPMYGKYDPFKNITENVNLPVPLLTRFDLIFVVRDIPSKERDRSIAKHIIDLHTPTGTENRSLIDVDILTKYLAYAKRFHPTLTKDAEDKIIDYYMKTRTVH